MAEKGEAAAGKAAETGYALESWLTALAVAEKGLGDEKSAFTLFQHSETPGQLGIIASALSALGKEKGRGEGGFETFIQKVDDSPYPLGEWIAAWERMHFWLEGTDKPRFPEKTMGYLECCAAAAASDAILPPFPEVVEEMLSQYGFAGAD